MARPYPERGRPGGDAAGPRTTPPGPRRRGPEGDVKVFGTDEQSDEQIDLARWVDLARGALIAEGIEGETELSLLFVGEEAIADLNRQFMEKVGPTDVLAFPIDEVGPTGRWPDAGSTGPARFEGSDDDLLVLLGDVVICPAVAARQARAHGTPLEDELALLVVHGILHVLGHDHAEPEETARMQARERELLDRLHHRRP